MRIAVTYEAGGVFQHFGRTERFKMYDVEGETITATAMLETNGNGHGALAGLLKDAGVDVLVCGGIGDGAKQALANADIRLYGGVSGDADRAVAELLAGTLVFNPDVACSHHGHHDHSHGEGEGCHQ